MAPGSCEVPSASSEDCSACHSFESCALDLSFYRLQQIHELSEFRARLDNCRFHRSRCVLNSLGYALERANIVTLDLHSATITGNEAFSASSFARRQASWTIAFVRFMSLEKLQSCAGNHKRRLRVSLFCSPNMYCTGASVTRSSLVSLRSYSRM